MIISNPADSRAQTNWSSGMLNRFSIHRGTNKSGMMNSALRKMPNQTRMVWRTIQMLTALSEEVFIAFSCTPRGRPYRRTAVRFRRPAPHARCWNCRARTCRAETDFPGPIRSRRTGSRPWRCRGCRCRDAVERLAGITSRLAEMVEAPGIAGVERVLGGGEVLRVGGPVVAIRADLVQIHDLAQARETVGIVIVVPGHGFHAVAPGAIFRVKRTAMFDFRLIDRRGCRKRRRREVPHPGSNPLDRRDVDGHRR